MKNNKKQLYEVLKHFDGMGKIEAYDLTHKLETLLYYASNPINTENLSELLESFIDQNNEIDPFHFTILPNGNFCEFMGQNDWLHIYKESKRLLPDWAIFETYYFKTKYAPLELQKLTKKNLLQDIKGKPEEKKVRIFLKKNGTYKKDLITSKLLLLEVSSS